MGHMIEITSDVGEEEFYRSERYHVPLVVMLINSKNKDIFDDIEKKIRKTDIMQQLSSELIVIFLSHTEYNEGVTFIDKVNQNLDFTYTISEFKESKSKFIKKLFSDNLKNIS